MNADKAGGLLVDLKRFQLWEDSFPGSPLLLKSHEEGKFYLLIRNGSSKLIPISTRDVQILSANYKLSGQDIPAE